MTTAANIVINDAQATPVAHTFVPLYQESGVWFFEDQSGDNAIGYNRIAMSITRPSTGRPGEDSSKRLVRVRLSVYTPILETLSNSTVSGITPAPTISYVCSVKTEFTLPERSTELDRLNLLTYLFGALGNSQLNYMVVYFRGITG